jgi:hypothetical protein
MEQPYHLSHLLSGYNYEVGGEKCSVAWRTGEGDAS